MHQQLKKMSLIGLILMIFTSVFGFANSPSAFYLMGYSAMPFYLFSALFFFLYIDMFKFRDTISGVQQRIDS